MVNENHLRLEINHGGQFESKQGIYYYKGGTTDTLCDVNISAMTLEHLLDYLQEAGYGKGLKIYYMKPGSVNKDGFKLIWNDDCINEIREDIKNVNLIELFVDHCAEEKGKNVVEEMDFGDDGSEDEVSDFEEEVSSESEHTEDDSESEGLVDSDIDEEAEEIRERKRKVREGLIDPLREGNLTDMNVGNGMHNVHIELENEHHTERPRTKSRSNRKHDPTLMGDMPNWEDVVQQETRIFDRLFAQFADNEQLECDKVGKSAEEADESDSFDAHSLEASDSSDNEEVQSKEMIKTKKKKKNQNLHFPTFNPKTPMENIEFEPGLIFTSRLHLKDAIRNYGVAKQRKVYLKRCDMKRMQAKCRDGCNWELWASRMVNDEAFQIKTYKKEHNCIIVSKQRMVKADWLAKEFGSIIRSNPRWKLKEFVAAVQAKYKLQCTLNQCWWAKKAAMGELEDVLKEHYARLWEYGAEVLRTNPGSSLFIKGEVTEEMENPIFQRLYICFNALKQGFLNGCRKIIGLDGCFLKGYVKGELLTAIGFEWDPMCPWLSSYIEH